jgi:protein phosphatase slingshot
MSRLRRFLSAAEAEDLAVTCSLKGPHRLSIISRRSSKRGDSEESVIIARKDGEDGNGEQAILAIAITSQLKYEFVGSGVFLVAPLGMKSKESYYFETTSLHDMWTMVTILEETLEFAKLDNIAKADGHEEWLRTYFESDPKRISEFVWEGDDGARSLFDRPAGAGTPPPGSSSDQKGPLTQISSKWCKPDLDELKSVISSFIRSATDPDDITESDVIEHLKSKYGQSIVGKYGYSKPEIQLWTYTFYGQMDKPSQIDDHLYLGSEYNAANLEELRTLGITHILNVTCEVSRHFPGEFKYHQVHVLDVPSVNLLPYFSRALSFMESGMNDGGAVL